LCGKTHFFFIYGVIKRDTQNVKTLFKNSNMSTKRNKNFEPGFNQRSVVSVLEIR